MRRRYGRSKMEGSLTLEQFNRAAKQFPHMGETTLEIARSVLVDGTSVHEIVTQKEIPRQSVHYWAKRIYDASLVSLPEGWVSKVVSLPSAKMNQVLKLEAQARKKLQQGSTTQ